MKDEDWIGAPVYDKNYGRRYSYLKPELDFYRKHRLAPPANHFLERVYGFWKEANSEVWRQTQCASCKKSIEATINQTYQNRKIYCRPCYIQYLEMHG